MPVSQAVTIETLGTTGHVLRKTTAILLSVYQSSPKIFNLLVQQRIQNMIFAQFLDPQAKESLLSIIFEIDKKSDKTKSGNFNVTYDPSLLESLSTTDDKEDKMEKENGDGGEETKKNGHHDESQHDESTKNEQNNGKSGDVEEQQESNENDHENLPNGIDQLKKQSKQLENCSPPITSKITSNGIFNSTPTIPCSEGLDSKLVKIEPSTKTLPESNANAASS